MYLSGKIDKSVTNNAGTIGSWSWDASNFHKDDVFDLSYYDPTYLPSYDISGFTEQELQIGNSFV